MQTTLRKIETIKVGETVLKEGFSWIVDRVESFRPSTGIPRTILTCRWDGQGRNPVAFKSVMSFGCKNGLEITVKTAPSLSAEEATGTLGSPEPAAAAHR